VERTFVARLRCPLTGGPLRIETADDPTEIRYGLLRSDAGVFPVVAGIPVLEVEERAADAVAALRKGRPGDALLRMVEPAWWPRPAAAAWLPGLAAALAARRRLAFAGFFRPDATAHELLDACFPARWPRLREAFNYLYYRFGQPRHLVSLALATLATEGPVLDLGSGAGHVSRYLGTRVPVVGMDHDFALLYVSRAIVAPTVPVVCADAERTWPFPDRSFPVVYSSDVLYALRRKAHVVQELERVLRPNGRIVVTALRNGTRPGAAGHPISPDAYERLFSRWPHRLIADDRVLDAYLDRRGPPLGQAGPVGDAETFSIVAAETEECFQATGGRLTHWPHAVGRLGFNPLYRARPLPGGVRLTLEPPSPAWEAEHGACRRYMPAEVTVPEAVLGAIEQGARPEAVQALVVACVLVALPDRYVPRPGADHHLLGLPWRRRPPDPFTEPAVSRA
jgi:SAM-dependent methyltransferase